MDRILMLFESEWMTGLGWTLIHSLWQMGLIAILILIVGRLTPSSKSGIRYWSSVGFMAIGLIWISLTFVSQVSSQGIASQTILISQVGKTLGMESKDQLTLFDRIGGYVELNMPVIVSVWLLGMVAFSFKLAGGWYYLHVLREKSRKITDPGVLELLSVISEKMSLERRVIMAESGSVVAPIMIGLLKPMILLPVSYINRLSIEETEAILAHELAHIKRHDFAINMVQNIVETLLFFNPFVWYISNTIRLEREHCCDDIAVKVTGEKKIYAQTLAAVQEIQLNRLALGMTGSKGKLLQRVERLFEPARRGVFDRWITAILMFAMIGGLYWQSQQINLQNIDLPTESASLYAGEGQLQEVYFVDADTIPPPPPKTREAVTQEQVPDIEETVEIEPDLDLAFEALKDIDVALDINIPEILEEVPMMELDIDQLMDISALDMNVFVDTIPVDMEEMKALMNEQMQFMREHQELMQEQMEVMKEEMARMQETMQSKSVQDALKMMRDMEFEGLSEEEMKRLKFETQKAHEEAMIEMRKAMKEMEMNRREWETEHSKMLKEQQFRQQEQMTQMKKEMEVAKSKMKEVEKKHKAFYKELKKELVKDGYLESEDSNLNMNSNNGEMRVNGKKVKDKDKQKYDKMKKEFFKE